MVRKKKTNASNLRVVSDRTELRDTSPRYKLKLRSKDMSSRSQSVIGAGWDNSKGGITIKLDPGVTISWRDMHDSMLTLWPVDEE